MKPESERVLSEARSDSEIKETHQNAEIKTISPGEFEKRMKRDYSEMFSNVDEILKKARGMGLSSEMQQEKEAKMFSMVEILQKAAGDLQYRTREKIKQTNDERSVEEKINDLLKN